MKNKSEKVKILSKPSCTSSKNAIKFFEENNIEYDVVHLNKKTQTLTFEEFKDLLRIIQEVDIEAGDDLSVIISRHYKEITKEMTLSELYQFLLENHRAWKTPIIYSETKLEIGFNDKEIRKFIPRSERKKDLKKFLVLCG